MPMSDRDALQRCLITGGVALFPSDTVYGLACDPNDRAAVQRLYALKGRDLAKPSAVMFFELESVLMALPELGTRTREAMRELLPGGVTFLIDNPEGHFPLACGQDPRVLGLRVPAVPALAGVGMPVLQSSANFAGGRDATRVQDVPREIRDAVDLVIDAGALPGTPSTVIDVRAYEDSGQWSVIREGAVPTAAVADALDWDPARYASEIRADIPAYERLQDELARASGEGASSVLDLGTGTGETAQRLLARHPDAHLTGVDASARMLAVASASLPAARVSLLIGRLEDTLPPGPFDLVTSALCVHHLPGPAKAQLFARVASVLAPGGRFVLADVVVAADGGSAQAPLTPGYDFPDSTSDQLRWLAQAGLSAQVSWAAGDLAVIVARCD
jgi:tRNA threonylcarbamoyl adenosine modification protein (Sua5/YciO/YrdC/YwlC family)